MCGLHLKLWCDWKEGEGRSSILGRQREHATILPGLILAEDVGPGYAGACSWATLTTIGYPGSNSGVVQCFLQDQLAKSAVEALTSLHGTKYKYGSIIDTICKLLASAGASCLGCSGLGVAD